MSQFYEISGEGREWYAEVFSGVHSIAVIEAVSEKQAHFLVKRDFPDAASPAEEFAKRNADYYSKEGYAWRAKQSKLNGKSL